MPAASTKAWSAAPASDHHTPLPATIRGRSARQSSAMDSDPIGSVLADPAKRSAAAQIIGQAYLTAVCCVRENREAVAAVAEALVQRKELYGDEVVELLEAADPRAPVIDVLDESIWPKL